MGVTCDFLSVITCTFPKRPSVQFTPKHGVLRTVKFGEWKVGDSFDSFAEFQQRIQALQDATAVQLYRREGKTLAASMQRYPGRDRTRAEPDKRNLAPILFAQLLLRVHVKKIMCYGVVYDTYR